MEKAHEKYEAYVACVSIEEAYDEVKKDFGKDSAVCKGDC